MPEMTYTDNPFTQDFYWVISSDDLSEFMAASIDEDPEPRIVFFEVEGQAREVSLSEAAPEGIRGSVKRLNKEECLGALEMLLENGFTGAIALGNGTLVVLTPIPMGSGEEM